MRRTIPGQYKMYFKNSSNGLLQYFQFNQSHNSGLTNITPIFNIFLVNVGSSLTSSLQIQVLPLALFI